MKKTQPTLEKTVIEKTEDSTRNEEKLKGILNASPDAILATDIEGNILDCNYQMEELSLFPRDELIGKSVFNFIEEKDRKKFSMNLPGYCKERSAKSESSAA